MKNAKIHAIHPNHLRNAAALRRSKVQEPPAPRPPRPPASTLRTTAKNLVDPTDYRHPYDSMGRFAKALALRYDARRTRHAYYRQLRLIHQHFNLDPALLTETQLRDDFLFVKLQKHWKPKSIRQHLHRLFQTHDWQVDPDVWGRNWGVHIQPSAKVKRLRVQCHAGGPVQLGASLPALPPPAPVPICPCCRQPMRLLDRILSPYRQRGPPATQTSLAPSRQSR